MPHRVLKRFYSGSNDDRHHIASAIRQIEQEQLPIYPTRIREKGSSSKGVECRDALELLSEVDLFFDEHPRKTLEVITKPPESSHPKKHHRR